MVDWGLKNGDGVYTFPKNVNVINYEVASIDNRMKINEFDMVDSLQELC